MPRICEICQKGSMAGRRIVRHGLAKKKGGIGLHVTGISARRFLPNLQRVHVVENGTVTIRRVCTSCIKRGKIQKA